MAAIQPILVPKWGMEMEEGTIQEWHVAEGSPIDKGDELVDIETSKIVNTLEASCSGILRRRVAQVGVTLPVGSLLGVCADNDVADADIESFIAGYLDQLDADTAPNVQPETATSSGAEITQLPDERIKASPSARKLAAALNMDLAQINGTGPRGRISKEDVQAAFDGSQVANREQETQQQETQQQDFKISPVAKRLAKKLGVDVQKIKGTGSHGRISKEDVERAAALIQATPAQNQLAAAPRDIQSALESSPKAGAQAGDEIKEIPLTATRKTIAARLTDAKQTIPHFYLTITCRVDRLLEFREQLNESQAVKISINDLVLKAAALALQQVPTVNSQFTEQTIKQFSGSHIAMAVATDRGLLTPVLNNVEAKGLAQIASESRALAEKAQTGGLQLEDLNGGTFSISNLGMFDVESFAAVINPPQAAILAVGTTQKVPTVRHDQVTIATQMKVTLSCDHRVIDGAVGSKWLQAFKSFIESPATMLL